MAIRRCWWPIRASCAMRWVGSLDIRSCAIWWLLLGDSSGEDRTGLHGPCTVWMGCPVTGHGPVLLRHLTRARGGIATVTLKTHMYWSKLFIPTLRENPAEA